MLDVFVVRYPRCSGQPAEKGATTDSREGKALQDEYRDDGCGDGVGDIGRDYSEPGLISPVSVCRRDWGYKKSR
jgi:hypothetical protein